MPSNFTPNYQLNQWEPEDQVLRVDFNADNAKLDAALKAREDGQAALQTAVTALQAAVPKKQDAASALKFTFGSYDGDDAGSRNIWLPFTPKAVLVVKADGETANYPYYYGGLALADSHVRDDSDLTMITIITNGFTVYKKDDSRGHYAWTNARGYTFNYIAFA